MADTAKWVRARLAAPGTLTEGEIVLRADRTQVQEDELLFLVGEEVVYRLDRQYYRTLTWFVDRPTFGEWLKARRATYPNANRPWSEDEEWQLHKEITDCGGLQLVTAVEWTSIARWHGRTSAAVQRKAKPVEATAAQTNIEHEAADQ